MAKNPLRNKYVAIGQWDASVTNLANNASASCTTGSVFIPEGALLTNAYYYVETTFADGNDDSAALSLGITGATGAFVASIAISATGTNGVASGQLDACIHGTLIGMGDAEEGDNAETALENADIIVISSDSNGGIRGFMCVEKNYKPFGSRKKNYLYIWIDIYF